MGAVFDHSGLADLRGDADVGSDPAGTAEEQLPAGAGPLLPEEQDEERDLGSLDLPDDDYTGDWRSDYGDSVGISSWRTL
jgi:hypothetical protein